MTDCMHELESGQLHRFGDWPIKTVPKSPGVYTVWDQTGRFIYVGKATTGGLFGRLNSHANGRRGGDQFNVYVADRFVLHGLTREQVAQIGAGTLPFDELVRTSLATSSVSGSARPLTPTASRTRFEQDTGRMARSQC